MRGESSFKFFFPILTGGGGLEGWFFSPRRGNIVEMPLEVGEGDTR